MMEMMKLLLYQLMMSSFIFIYLTIFNSVESSRYARAFEIGKFSAK